VESYYVHVPFCAQKCSYCAFYSHPPEPGLADRYVHALGSELRLRTARLARAPRTIFFGGGTPTLLTIRQWEQVFEAFEAHGLTGAAEWTVECNPATLSSDKARLLRARGVNRVSMGVQSMDPRLLDRLGRAHTREMVFRSFDILRAAGFHNINLDLMFAIPGQDLDCWQGTLTEVLALGSEHVSCYEVIYEEDTPLYRQLQAAEFSVDEDLACAMYETLLDRAAAAGLRQYEVANFARDTESGDPGPVPAHACRHNIAYWRGTPFVGLGPSAASFLDGRRTKNWSNTTLYCERVEAGQAPIESVDRLPPRRRAGEIAAFGLRMTRGWDFREFEHATGFALEAQWGAELDELAGRGWGLRTGQGFRLTTAGLRFADAAAELFLD
jgi:oxygen-independent coproporphyrinogen-3 oxidase